MEATATHLAELHWIAYLMPARIHGMDAPAWEDLPKVQRNALTTAMRLLLELEHVKPGY